MKPRTGVTERKKAEALIQYQALYDELTDLPNRRLFEDRLKQVVKRSKRSGQKFALFYMDLDFFKQANDQFGHALGDDLLQAVAKRLKETVRESDTVARIGGDEFAALLINIQSLKDVEAIAHKINTSIGRLFVIDGQEVQIGISIGVSIYPDHGKHVDALTEAADTAMYKVKETERGSYQIAD